MNRSIYTLLSLFCLTASSLVFAHHGTFTFDGNTTITLEGEIVRFNWTNPHSSLVLAVTDNKGILTEYFVEADGPSILGPLGVTQNSLQPGDKVIAYVSPSRNKANNSKGNTVVLGREIIKEDGTIIGLSVAYTRRLERDNAPQTRSVIGTWVPDQRALFDFVESRANWPLTEAGKDSIESYNTLAVFPQSECIPATSPTLLMYPTAKVFTQSDTFITLNTDWMGARRTIYMNIEDHPPATERFLLGHSIGRWQGTRLLVDTRNYTDNSIGLAFGISSGVNKHLEEVFELGEDGRTLSYTYTLEDSDYLAEPVSGSYLWHFRPDISASTLACDPDVASRYLND